jgi:uncharacterized protein YndB with AHSA1/START domain
MEIVVEVPVEQVFRLFTERMHDWWRHSDRLGTAARIGLLVEPRPDGRWYERSADGTEYDWGRVLDLHPPQTLALSWQIGRGFTPQSNPERASRVDVTFVESGPRRTTITLVHGAFERHGEGGPPMRAAVAGPGGWPEKLRAYADLALSER